MRKLIPLHSLVITVGPDPDLNDERVRQEGFSEHEIVSASSIRFDLVGDKTRRDIDATVYAELHRRVETKLRLGERVVVSAANLRRDGRAALANIGVSFGVPVFYLVYDDPNADTATRHRVQSAAKDFLRGDGIAEVIDMGVAGLDPVKKNFSSDLEALKSKFNGITVIGDIHGMRSSLLSALEWARSRRHFVIFLGDVVDYGPHSLECANEVYQTVMRGNGELIIGNHERKIARWIDQPERSRHMMRLSDGNKITTNALSTLGNPYRDQWMNRFRGLVARSPYRLRLNNTYYTHAAVHPSAWTATLDHKNMENLSLFGEFDTSAAPASRLGGPDRPPRTYNWIDAIPSDTLVFVGHDARSMTNPVVQTNVTGGQAVFMDTGAGKGGFLSSVDLRWAPEGLKLENYCRH
jgi:protein phosphatase